MRLVALAPSPPDAAAPTSAARASMHDDERALVVRARRGDLAAFEALYRLNGPRVHALCLRLAGDVARAEELVQEVFLRAWSNLASFRGDCRFATWLHPVAVRLALDDRRARQRGPERAPLGEATAETIAPATRPTDDVEAGFDLERALRRLPPRARAVFVLHDIEGHPHEAIAAMLGVDPGTSKSQLHRARRLLREALDR